MYTDSFSVFGDIYKQYPKQKYTKVLIQSKQHKRVTKYTTVIIYTVNMIDALFTVPEALKPQAKNYRKLHTKYSCLSSLRDNLKYISLFAFRFCIYI